MLAPFIAGAAFGFALITLPTVQAVELLLSKAAHLSGALAPARLAYQAGV